MKFAYYPGCTLKNKAKQLDIYARKCAEALGITLEEIKDWQCCGGTYTSAKDEIVTKLSSYRALAAARDMGEDLVTVCAACHHVIKRANEDIKDEYVAARVNNYLDESYHGETKVIHYIEMLRDVVGFDKIKSAVKYPINKKVAAYYGCLLLRPASAMQFDDPENPTILEEFISAIGGTPVISPYRNECCGGYVTLTDRGAARERSGLIVDSFAKKGASVIVTACPLCTYNLKNNSGGEIPVVYFTELLAEALGVKE